MLAMTSNVPVSLTVNSTASQPSRRATEAAANTDKSPTATCGPIRFGLMITMTPRGDDDPRLERGTGRKVHSAATWPLAGKKVNGSVGSNLIATLPAYTLPPAIVSFVTGAPLEKSSSSSGTQNVLGLVAESK